VRSHDFFRKFAHTVAAAIGSPYAFLIATVAVIAWAVCGPMFGFSTGWQLVINTGTTITTFLVVFLIQSTQNHDSHAVHLKLDELIRAVQSARNKMLDVETLPDEELAELEAEFRQIRLRGEQRRQDRARRDNNRHRADRPDQDRHRADRPEQDNRHQAGHAGHPDQAGQLGHPGHAGQLGHPEHPGPQASGDQDDRAPRSDRRSTAER
jgi:low affinity Fe/Cu permease